MGDKVYPLEIVYRLKFYQTTNNDNETLKILYDFEIQI